MSTIRPVLPLSFSANNPKQQGEYAEMRFQVAAAEHGLFLSKPYGDSMPYDFIADNLKCFLKIQVKSVAVRHRGQYHVKVNSQRRRRLSAPRRAVVRFLENRYMISICHKHKYRAYKPPEIDFVAALVIPESVWYIVPVRAVGRRTAISVFPHNPESRGMFESYKEAWYLLQ